MRDLELRGAGNLLGGTQSGHSAVGYDLYCEMVTEAVAELKGDPVDRTSEINIDLPIKAFLPTNMLRRKNSDLRHTENWLPLVNL